MDIKKFLKVLLSLYVRESSNQEHDIHRIRKVCVHQFAEKVGTRKWARILRRKATAWIIELFEMLYLGLL